ncbi:MFS general substrate transporter [Coprinopsis marcescibilis]|uniref:MFS general substrate transporter n=1 Tax=Coprinopsis marcescibilis TaxID=230819 RepID=A0A5C3KSY1_COPMA|nr:MFS general substrate transporter [Coprinopsis marcescibilis]
MNMPWSAASPKFFANSKTEDAGSSGIAGSISAEIQNVRSAIESRFNKAKATASPKNPFIDPPKQEAIDSSSPSLSRHIRVHRHAMPPPPRQMDQYRQQQAPRSADPRAAGYEYRLPDPRVYHRSSRREKRSGAMYDAPPPRYEGPRTALPHGYPGHGYSRTPTSPSAPHWPSEKTPTSPYRPRHHHDPHGSPRRPHYYRDQPPVPHTAHPGGSFHRSSPREAPNPATAGETRENAASGGYQCNFLDSFTKVKHAPLPSPARPDHPEGAFPSPQVYTPIPPPPPRTPSPDQDYREPLPQYTDNRNHGFYEYQTPSYPSFDRKDGDSDLKSPYRNAEGDYVIDIPDDESKYDEELADEPPRKMTLKERFHELLLRFKLWLAARIQRPKSRIPSCPPDLESQTLEQVERELREAFVLSWTTVAGAWLVQFVTFGYIWSWGVFQDYYMINYPDVHTSASRLSWIGSLQLMLTFAFGLLSGKLFDAGWFHFSAMFGSALFGMGLFTLSFVDPAKFFQLFLVQGIFMGCGLGLVFLPTILVVQLHFPQRKGLMTGVVMSGSSFGAMLFPILVDKLLPPKGFGGTVRITSYIVVALLVIANCLMAVPTKRWNTRFSRPSLVEYLREVHYAAAIGAIFLVFLTMWFPQYYMEEFAVRHGVNPNFAFYSLALIALGGMMGRVVMGFAADKLGPWNLLVPVTFMVGLTVCLVMTLKTAAALGIVGLIYGFMSASWLSLLITALSSLAVRQSEMGHRVGFALTCGSLGAFLTGSAQAAILSSKWNWAAPVGFFAFLLFACAGIFAYVRYLISNKRRFAYV